MTTTLIAKMRVAEFGTWKREFEQQVEGRREHGWLSHRVLRDATDPNLVVVVSRVRDAALAKQWIAAPRMREGMQRAGVLGPPEMAFHDDADELTY